MGIQQIMLGTSPAGDTYWIKSDGVDTAGYKLEYNGVHVDTAGNVYTYGKTNDPWNTSNPWRYDRICFHKYDKHGTNVFYKRFSNNTNAQEPHYQNALVGLSDGSMVFTTRSNLASVKMNSSGSILYKRGYGTSSSSLDSNFTSISVNSSDQTLYTGYEATGNSGTINVFRINSNGTLSGDWQVSVSSSGNYGVNFSKTGTDSSGNVYIIGSRGQSGTYDKDGYIMKLNSSMVIQWQHTLGSSGYYPIDQWYDLAFDSSDNIYCVGTHRDGNSRHFGWIVKYNSSGTIQWQKKFGNGTQNLYFWSIAIDDDDNIYCQGSVDLYGSTPFWVKLNTSGVVQYQRDLRESNNNANADWIRTMTVSGDAIYMVGRRYIGYQKHFGWIAKLPKAGIDTGTYDNKYTISEPSYTMSNTSFTTDRVSVGFTIADVTNKNTYNTSYSVSTNSNPTDIKSAYDIVDD